MKKLLACLLLGLCIISGSSYNDVNAPAVKPGTSQPKMTMVESKEQAESQFIPWPNLRKHKLIVPLQTPMQRLTHNYTRPLIPKMQPTWSNLLWFMYGSWETPEYWENIQDYQVGAYCTPSERAYSLNLSFPGYLWLGCTTGCQWHINNGLHYAELGISDWNDEYPDGYVVTSFPNYPY